MGYLRFMQVQCLQVKSEKPILQIHRWLLIKLVTCNDALFKIGSLGSCMNLLCDKSTLIRHVFCSNIRLSNDSRRLFAKLMRSSFIKRENASNSMKLIEFRFSSNVFSCCRCFRMVIMKCHLINSKIALFTNTYVKTLVIDSCDIVPTQIQQLHVRRHSNVATNQVLITV